MTNPIAQKQGGARPSPKGQLCTIDTKTHTLIQPEFARFKLLYCGHTGSNPKGYSPYYSIDWNTAKGGYYDEAAGLHELLRRKIYDKPAHWCVWAKLYINLTLNLSTKGKGYNHEIMYFRGHQNYMPVFTPIYNMDKTGTRINITETLLALRPIEEWNKKRKYYLGL